MQDDELLRYSRHILLDDIGIEGQTRILQGHALVVGAGGLGSPVLMYLAAAGVGHITLIDHDTVDLTNLQRQIAHRTDSVGQPKVDSARRTANDLNPHVKINSVQRKADDAVLAKYLPAVDVVIDCTDNFATRQSINAACVRYRKPLVSGAAIQFDGQISVYDSRDTNSPCYACIFPPSAHFEEVRCSTMGVFSPLVGIIGTMQAAEALKLLSGAGRTLTGRLLMLDGRAMEWTDVRMQRSPTCPVCGPSCAPHASC
jgi:molybdopterin/thiamine biosynthesis adenylyltransferase